MKSIIPLFTAILLLGGCVTPPVSYYYGRYSQTLYRSKKDSTPAALAKHKQTLEDIIQTSEKRGHKVPPGIYCEYAYVLAKEGNAEADRYFNLEVKTYPESTKFVGFVRSQINSSDPNATATK